MTPDATVLSRQYTDLLRANGCSERTIDNYVYALKGFTRFLGERPLTSASADHIVAYQLDVAARLERLEPAGGDLRGARLLSATEERTD